MKSGPQREHQRRASAINRRLGEVSDGVGASPTAVRGVGGLARKGVQFFFWGGGGLPVGTSGFTHFGCVLWEVCLRVVALCGGGGGW